ncbi:hypothetical protein TUM4438_11800 [Shewanella sairae]|uniref:Uncharacterized protein n=1 Tax=Shewanella sairae TaxID=190310 RepID=A0ABQ4P792_9GAMM|nr:hypothetical protein TUM4438_11800 [Shewanella sairae]
MLKHNAQIHKKTAYAVFFSLVSPSKGFSFMPALTALAETVEHIRPSISPKIPLTLAIYTTDLLFGSRVIAY